LLCVLRLRASVSTLRFIMAPGCEATPLPGGRRRWADIDSDDESVFDLFGHGGGAGHEQATAFKAPATDGKLRGADIKSHDGRTTASSGSVASDSPPRSCSSRCDDSRSDDASTVSPMSDEARWFGGHSDDDLRAPQMASESCRSFGAPGEACSEPSTASIAAPTGSDDFSSDDDSTAPPMASRRGAAGFQGHVGLSAPAMPSEVQLPTPEGRSGRGSDRRRKCRGHRSAMQDNGQHACGVKQPPSSTEGSADVETQSVWVERLPPKLCHDFFFSATFEQSGVLPSVLEYQVIPLASAVALLVDFSDRRAAEAYVEHFSLPFWAQHGGVKAKVLPPVRLAAQQT